MRPLHLAAILLSATALTAGGVYAALEVSAPAASPLAAYAPPGALLTLESTDFGSLLQSWNSSAEQRRWLTSDDYAAFSRSRLFGRLGDAQSEFATVAGLAPDTHFLEQVAGTDSLFVWYDIGNLEFLYVSRLSPEQSQRLPLLALRDKFEQRQAGGVTFYVRTSEDADNGGSASPAQDPYNTPRSRTVAFAVRGDLLLLATREDLIAGALEQIAHPGGRALATDGWYAASVAAAHEKPGDLRLTLNLAKITRSPYFRTYWVQQNITAMRRYTAALSDLYREHGIFREERFLLPASGAPLPPDADLNPALHFLPAGVVYRAVGHPSAADTLAELQDKLLARTTTVPFNTRATPSSVDLTVPIAGSPSDFEDRIDTPVSPKEDPDIALAGAQSLLNLHAPVAMLSFSSATVPDSPAAGVESKRDIFRSIHAGVVLTAETPCDAAGWQQALTAALSSRLSVGDGGLHWTKQLDAKITWFHLDGQFPLAFAADGNACLFASDSATLLAMISANGAAATHRSDASTIAGFSHSAQRDPLLEMAKLLDHGSPKTISDGPQGVRPHFFSGNMASLSMTFQDLDSESFIQSQPSPTLTRQTVTYVFVQK